MSGGRLRFAAAMGLALSAASSDHVVAQAPVHVQQYTADDGLAQNAVRSVAVDRYGFIWVATVRGLQRFDGYTFTPHAQLDRTAPPQLSSQVTKMSVGRGGALLVNAGERLFEVSPASARATELVTGVSRTTWAQDSSGAIWYVQGKRLWRVDRASQPTSPVDVAAVPGGVGAMSVSPTGEVWIAKHGGATGAVTRVRPSGEEATWPLSAVVDVLCAYADASGRFWVGGREGLEVFEPATQRFRVVPALQGNEVNDIEPHGDGVLVPARTAIVHLDGEGRVVERFEAPQALSYLPQDLAIDRDGGIWLATYAGGVMRLDARRPLFEHITRAAPPFESLGSDFVTAFHEQRDGTLWIGTLNDGAYALPRGAKALTAYRHDVQRPGSLVAGNVWSFEEVPSGELWFGMSTGPCIAQHGRVQCYPIPGGIHDIVSSHDGWLWASRGPWGAVAFDTRTRTLGDSIPMHQFRLTTTYFDPDSSQLWLGGSALFRVRVRGGQAIGDVERVEAMVADDRVIWAMFRDAQKNLWLGTENGLQRWDARARRFAPVDVPELRGSTVFSIHEDADQRLWIGTAHGLVSYSAATGIARRYRREDGVRSGEFNRRAVMRTASGEMWFGGILGITRFHPAAITGRRDSPPVVVTRVHKLTATGIEDGRASQSDSTVTLLPGDRALTIAFAALSYGPGPARRYRYRLEPLNDDWIETGDHSVTYPAPAPGNYVFRVQAAAGSGDGWSEGPGALHIEVIPPFWKTAWFRLALLTTLGVILWSLHRLRLARAIATERLRLRISRDLHDQIGAGLSGIALLTDSVEGSATMDPGSRLELRKIASSARDMVGDLRDIVWSIDPDADRLEDIIARMRDVADTLLRRIAVTFDIQEGAHLTRKVSMHARHDLLLLYKEALHNIARHAHATSVTVSLRVSGARLHLAISDDGVGFALGDETAGVGLRSMRERAKRLGAHLAIDSAPGRGTTVRVSLEVS